MIPITEGDDPWKRIRSTITIDEIENKSGTYLIEILGGMKAVRALVNKGHLSILDRVMYSSTSEVRSELEETLKNCVFLHIKLDLDFLFVDFKFGGSLAFHN